MFKLNLSRKTLLEWKKGGIGWHFCCWFAALLVVSEEGTKVH